MRLSEGGPAFARLMRDLPYTTGAVILDPGDRLVLFTDGVSEAEDAVASSSVRNGSRNSSWSTAARTAQELEATISETVLEHADGDLQDDLTLVVLAVG